MLKPVNGHLLIDPVVHDSFIASQKETFEEIGVVVAIPELYEEIEIAECPKVGDRVYFDSWTASKYPTPDDKFFWLVKLEDIRAIESKEW